MNCAHVRDILPLYLENDLEPQEEEAVARHLAICADCRSRSELHRELAVGLASLAAPRAEARAARLRARVRGHVKPGPQGGVWYRNRLTSMLARGPSTALGLASIAVLLVLFVVLGSSSFTARSTWTSTPQPVPTVTMDAAGTGVGKVARPIYVLSSIPGPNGTTTGRVSAVDPRTGREVASIAAGTDLDAVASTDGATLFVASVPSGGAAGTDDLAAFATRDGKELWRVPIDNRVKYIMNGGPSTLVLSPDEQRLYVYHYQVQGTPSPRPRDTSNEVNGWLAAVDAATGKPLAGSIPLSVPFCGGAVFQLLPGSRMLVVTCFETSELRFVDLTTNQVTDHLSGFGPGSVVAALLTPDGRWLYVVTDTFQVIIVDPATHAIARRIDLARPDGGKSAEGLAALSGDGTRLVVGEEIEATPGTTSATDLQVYDTGTWQNVGRVHFDQPLARTLVPAPDGTSVYAIGSGPNASSHSSADTVYAIDLVDRSTHVAITRPGEGIIRVFTDGLPREPTPISAVRQSAPSGNGRNQ